MYHSTKTYIGCKWYDASIVGSGCINHSCYCCRHCSCYVRCGCYLGFHCLCCCRNHRLCYGVFLKLLTSLCNGKHTIITTAVKELSQQNTTFISLRRRLNGLTEFVSGLSEKFSFLLVTMCFGGENIISTTLFPIGTVVMFFQLSQFTFIRCRLYFKFIVFQFLAVNR